MKVVLQIGNKRRKFLEYVIMWPKLVYVMNCIRKMNSYTTSFTYSLAMVLFLEED